MMNVIVDKLDLPCDMKREIKGYCINEVGYSGEDLKSIEKIKGKRRNKFMKLRQKLELAQWYTMGVSVYWLHAGRYGGGVYGKQHPSKVYGGGTKAETQYFRYYNGLTSYCKRIGDPENDYIEKLIEKGERRRANV